VTLTCDRSTFKQKYCCAKNGLTFIFKLLNFICTLLIIVAAIVLLITAASGRECLEFFGIYELSPCIIQP